MQGTKDRATTAIPHLIWSILSVILCSITLMIPLIATATPRGPVSAFSPDQPSKPVPLSSPSPEVNALATGKFLIASQRLRDTNFSQTVVLLIHYDQHGAMGLTINVPTEATLATVFPDIQGLRQKDDLIFMGGPVKQNRMFLLLQADEPVDDAHAVVADIYASTSRKLLDQVARGQTIAKRWRLYVGYAGWAAGQLENEVSRGDWRVLPADAKTVFDTPTSEIWPNLIRQAPLKWLWLHKKPATSRHAQGLGDPQ